MNIWWSGSKERDGGGGKEGGGGTVEKGGGGRRVEEERRKEGEGEEGLGLGSRLQVFLINPATMDISNEQAQEFFGLLYVSVCIFKDAQH